MIGAPGFYGLNKPYPRVPSSSTCSPRSPAAPLWAGQCKPKSRRVKGDLNAAPIGARSYACFTGADRAKVWAVLIGADKTDGYLYGLVTRSSWQRGAPIQFQAGQFSTADCSLMGRVLVVQPPCRLSYLLRAGPEDPPDHTVHCARVDNAVKRRSCRRTLGRSCWQLAREAKSWR
jgi:hypothetical protein